MLARCAGSSSYVPAGSSRHSSSGRCLSSAATRGQFANSVHLSLLPAGCEPGMLVELALSFFSPESLALTPQLIPRAAPSLAVLTPPRADAASYELRLAL